MSRFGIPRPKFQSVLTMVVLCFWLSPALGHRYAMSQGMVEHNKSTKSLELSIQLFNHDLDQVFPKICQRYGYSPCSHEEALLSYTRDGFKVLKAGKILPWRWVGVSREIHHTYIFLELIGHEKKPENITFEHNLLKDFFPRQANRVVWRTRPDQS
ncbi:DUF6702 family protein [Pseudobacteriovorax antillogorgiicola]|uniref:Uncharacterized protein n=1 Tax=Pseudobacteriovorax antillogorgiicola TaxID=1513793 RepID=A0A1Y6BZL5_9BACT|nr:DUF6702 family protein [Pseudobacteriovorax antillogorgiicola]TCS53047.1 hypothetical protein EDD56_10898 [Pseudobacteriovorax antillogorgiicola]SMF26437.1 hypothetical protein SAMN06296036_108149 [Pseudobacteriovorax antillogorgiicola]